GFSPPPPRSSSREDVWCTRPAACCPMKTRRSSRAFLRRMPILRWATPRRTWRARASPWTPARCSTSIRIATGATDSSPRCWGGRDDGARRQRSPAMTEPAMMRSGDPPGAVLALLFVLVTVAVGHVAAAPRSFAATGEVEIAFTPGDAIDKLIVDTLGRAKSEILVHAYTFTDRRIAQALVA